MILKDDTIITAFAEYASIVVIVRGVDNKLRVEYIHPFYNNAEMKTLFNVSYAAHQAMKSAVESMVRNR